MIFDTLFTKLSLNTLFLANTASTEDITNPVKEVLDIAEGINNYGFTAIIVAVFIVIFIGTMVANNRHYSNIVKKYDKANTDSMANVQKMLNAFVENTLANKNNIQSNELQKEIEDEDDKHKEPKDLIAVYIDAYVTFKDALKAGIDKLQAQRMAIYVFHNGNESHHGFPFFKMSCVHEWTIRGSSTLRGKSHINMPLYVFSDIVESLYKDNEFICTNLDNFDTTSGLLEFAEYSKMKAMCFLGVRDSEYRLAGFVVAEFDSNIDTIGIDELKNIKKHMTDVCDNIRFILTNQDFQKEYTSNSNR